MTNINEQPTHEPEDAGRQAERMQVSAGDDNAGPDVDASKREVERPPGEQGGENAEPHADENPSGETPARPVLEKLLADVRSGYKDFDHVLVTM